jgi:hypothetical protein
MKKIIVFITAIIISNLNASWKPNLQYGIMPCDLTIKIYDSSGNILIGPFNGKNPPIFSCGNPGTPAYVRFEIVGGPNFNVYLDSTSVQSLPCLGNSMHAFTFTKGKPGPICDSTYYINY